MPVDVAVGAGGRNWGGWYSNAADALLREAIDSPNPRWSDRETDVRRPQGSLHAVLGLSSLEAKAKAVESVKLPAYMKLPRFDGRVGA